MKKFKDLPKAKKYVMTFTTSEVFSGDIKIRKIKNATVWKWCVGTYLEWINEIGL